MKTILLAEPDIDLKENIIELLQIEGYSVIDILKGECHNISDFNNKHTTGLVNGVLLHKDSYINKFITDLMANKIPMAIFSPDPDDTHLISSGKWMPLPFEPDELFETVKSGFKKNNSNALAH